MQIIKILNTNKSEFIHTVPHIALCVTPDHSYYLVEQPCGYGEDVSNIPEFTNVVKNDIGGIIEYVSWLSNQKIEVEIARTEIELQSTDFKVIKSYEYSLVGKEVPYNIVELHEQRQPLREKIDTLRLQIKPVKTWAELSNIIVFDK